MPAMFPSSRWIAVACACLAAAAAACDDGEAWSVAHDGLDEAPTDGAGDPAPASDGDGRVVPPSDAQDLTAASSWRLAVGDEDPFVDHRPADLRCPDQAWHVVDALLEIDTQVCNFVALAQPSLVDVGPGDRLTLTVWHQRLLPVDDARTAHLAVAFDDEVLWEKVVALPHGESATYAFDVPAPAEPVPAGARVVLHLHNHGNNSWIFGALTRKR